MALRIVPFGRANPIVPVRESLCLRTLCQASRSLLLSFPPIFALSLVVTPDPKHPFSIHREIQSSKSIKRPSWTKIQRDQSCWEVLPKERKSASSEQGENEHRIMALFFFLLLLISHREQPLRVQDDRMRDLPPTPRNRKCFHTIDRHRLIPIFKEEIGDPKFFYPIQKVFSAGRLVGVEKGPYSVPHSVLLSALPDNIYLHKLDQEIGRIQQKYEIPIVQRIRSVLLRTGRIDDQEDSGEEASFNPSPRQQSHHCGEGKEHPTQSGLSFPCFVVAHPLPQAPPGSGGTRKGAATTFTKSERLSTTRSAGLQYSPRPTSTNPRRGNIIPKYSKDSNIVNKEGGKTLAEFPNSIELGKLGPGQDPNNKEHSTTSLV
ncbi:hypothetical protein L1987_89644 [Smallanthus sonchifolius]|nr:hypothetical protein L1987_89644 [Smallanthus sonchifolius]